MPVKGIQSTVQGASGFSRTTAPRPSPRTFGEKLAYPLQDLMLIEIDWNWRLEHSALVDQNPHLERTLEFNFFDNEAGIIESSNVNYNDIDIIGRPEAFKVYASTTNKEIQLSLHFQAQGLDLTGSSSRSRSSFGDNVSTVFLSLDDMSSVESDDLDVAVIQDEVINPVRFLDSLKYPIVDEESEISFAPPPCLLQLGQLFLGRVVVTEVQIVWKAPYDPLTFLPLGADVQLAVAVVRTVPTNYYVPDGPMTGQWVGGLA